MQETLIPVGLANGTNGTNGTYKKEIWEIQ